MNRGRWVGDPDGNRELKPTAADMRYLAGIKYYRIQTYTYTISQYFDSRGNLLGEEGWHDDHLAGETELTEFEGDVKVDWNK